jgi:hypothetical protein
VFHLFGFIGGVFSPMKNFWHLPLENQSLVCQRGCLSRVESTRKNWEWWGLKRPPFSRMRHWAALGPEPQTALPWKQRMQPHKPVHLEATQKTTPVSSPLRSVFEKRQTLLPGIVESWQFTDTLVRAQGKRILKRHTPHQFFKPLAVFASK